MIKMMHCILCESYVNTNFIAVYITRTCVGKHLNTEPPVLRNCNYIQCSCAKQGNEQTGSIDTAQAKEQREKEVLFPGKSTPY